MLLRFRQVILRSLERGMSIKFLKELMMKGPETATQRCSSLKKLEQRKKALGAGGVCILI